MADNIIGNMFGVDPDQLRMQRFQQAQQQNVQIAQLDPFQRASATMANVGAGATMLGAQALGLQTPEEKLAASRKQALAGLDTTDPDAVNKAAQALNQAGDTQGAAMLAQHARQLTKEKSALSLQAAQTEKALREPTERVPLTRQVADPNDPTKVITLTYDPANPEKGWVQLGGVGEKFAPKAPAGSKPSAAGDFLAKNPDTVNFIADRVLAGDTKAAQGYGKSADAQAMIAKAIQERGSARGISPEQLTNVIADYSAYGKGQAALGTQSAKMVTAGIELKNMIDLTKKTVSEVNPTDLPAVNTIANIYNMQTGDPKIVKLKNNLNAVVNIYARAISPTGSPTVSDKEHAREILMDKYGNMQFGAAFDAIEQEANIAIASPTEARKALSATRISELPPKSGQLSGKKVVKWGDLK